MAWVIGIIIYLVLAGGIITFVYLKNKHKDDEIEYDEIYSGRKKQENKKPGD